MQLVPLPNYSTKTVDRPEKYRSKYSMHLSRTKLTAELKIMYCTKGTFGSVEVDKGKSLGVIQATTMCKPILRSI
jgi:hypothetical protein